MTVTDSVPESAPESSFQRTSVETLTSSMNNDPLFLASSDHPGMMLTYTPFNGGNFFGWSRTIKMALGAKLKLGFIDGTTPKPAVTDAFLYAQSAQELWKEIGERYGQGNGPLIYQVERELNKVSQGDLFVAAYYNKMKRFWDELTSLNGVPNCVCGKMQECACGITKKFQEIESRTKLMQFLMRLNDGFESVRNQILSMDPLPNINKAYYIVQQVEKQKQVTTSVPDPSAYFANQNSHKQGFRRDNRNGDQIKMKNCTYCKQDGHSYEQCFERLGYPDWYKGKKTKKGSIMAAQVGVDLGTKDSPFDYSYENELQGDKKSEFDQNLVATVCAEMMKMLKGKQADIPHAADVGSSTPHAGIDLTFYERLHALACHVYIDIEKDWVTDSGATDHMIPHLHLLESIRILHVPIKVKLPDGNIKLVTKVGQVKINSSLTLTDVFYVPEFQINLLSVGQLLNSKPLIAIFGPSWFAFQDLSTNQLVTVGKGHNKLYVCKPSESLPSANFSASVLPLVNTFVNNVAKISNNVSIDLFHARLGHTSKSKMIHVDAYKHVNIPDFSCDTCLLSKQHRLPFSRSHSHSSIPFELIHVDL
uniref:uncharacterized protein LOC122587575 n=1 Tax=Erigeron canadensis TaxID=72917 RepID=UPI001CB95586|nr:uncharacterized protein LOC122587575 [Erigeron canadensis]